MRGRPFSGAGPRPAGPGQRLAGTRPGARTGTGFVPGRGTPCPAARSAQPAGSAPPAAGLLTALLVAMLVVAGALDHFPAGLGTVATGLGAALHVRVRGLLATPLTLLATDVARP